MKFYQNGTYVIDKRTYSILFYAKILLYILEQFKIRDFFLNLEKISIEIAGATDIFERFILC